MHKSRSNPKSYAVQDAEKSLRSLKSGSQPMVKKRQLMQSAFGDYRKKMAEEEKKLRVGQYYMASPHCFCEKMKTNNFFMHQFE